MHKTSNQIRRIRRELKREVEITLAELIFQYDTTKYKTTRKLKEKMSPTQIISFNQMVRFFCYHPIAIADLESIRDQKGHNTTSYQKTKSKVIRLWKANVRHYSQQRLN